VELTALTLDNLLVTLQLRLRILVSVNNVDRLVSPTDFLDEARLDTKELQVLYRDQSGVHVMDTRTYEQYSLDEEIVGDAGPWLQPEMVVQVEWLNGRHIAIDIPSVIELDVVETSPVMRSATKTDSTKPAKLSNGVTVQVPDSS